MQSKIEKGKSKVQELIESKSFSTRLVTGIIVAAVVAIGFIFGYTIMLVFLGILSLIGLWEFYRANNLLWQPFAVTGFIADILYYILIRFYGSEYTTIYMVLLFAFYAIADIIIFVIKYPKYSLQSLFTSYFAVIYVGLLFSFLYLIRVHSWGAYLVWLAVIAAWGCDICAYLGGMILGKRKLFPVLSPKKTWEGCVSGVVGAGLFAFIYALIVSPIIESNRHDYLLFPLICMVAAVIGIFGDLFASAVKRQTGIKDYSSALPGHGGILDRFDSLIVIAPVVYAVTILIRYWS